MDRGRDHWGCNCEKYAEQSPWKVDDPDRPEIPVHPNCMCEWRPRLKTDAEILSSLREEMKEDLETIQGTDEQKDKLERIDADDLAQETIKEEEVKTVERFSPEFSRFMDDVKEKIGNTQWSDIPKDAQDAMNRKLKEAGIDLDGETFLKEVDKMIAEGTIVRHENVKNILDNLDSFERDPRIKTLFETGTSEGSPNPAARNDWELNATRKTKEVIDAGCIGDSAIEWMNEQIGGVKNRAVYGEVVPKGFINGIGGEAFHYGDIHLELSNGIRNRTTYTSEDSAGMTYGFTDNSAASLERRIRGTNLPDHKNMDNLIWFYEKGKGLRGIEEEYLETQIWGGVDFSRGDVKTVVIEESDYNKHKGTQEWGRFMGILDKLKIPLRIVGTLGEYTV